jgi:dipeptidyl aminopeptidase/acylaminoacyl peptidase
MRALLLAGLSLALAAQTPPQAPTLAPGANLTAEGIPSIPLDLARDLDRYGESRAASFSGWHPVKREMLISTRFGDTPQVHRVAMPMGARTQLTFERERIGGASFEPTAGQFMVYAKDVGGGEFFQLFRQDLDSGKVQLLTDGKSRNTGGAWRKDGGRMAFSSTRRTGSDTDIWTMDPRDPATAKLVLEVKGGGWGATDWSPDGKALLVGEFRSILESDLHLLDLAGGQLTKLTLEKASYSDARFSRDGKAVYLTTDLGSEFHRLARLDLATKKLTFLRPDLGWDVDSFDLSDDGALLAYLVNEDGVGRLRVMDLKSGKDLPLPKLPLGSIGGLDFHKRTRELGFNLTSAQSPSDVYSIDLKTLKLSRWTQSETGGLDAAAFPAPEVVRWKSFDGRTISGLLYRPPAKFAGPRPVVINIHGGPEGQSRPGFLGRNNYLLNELGVAILLPNVRGSSGYGKGFLALDNGAKREDSVKDIGALLDWLPSQAGLDKDRVLVTGGSYGGYMTLACMTHYNDRLRAGLDVVGISNFVTFLKNTEGYRRDLRRVEYGDERDPAMHDLLQRISPLTNAAKITKPMFIVQGRNDPRVPYTEARQMVEAIRKNNGPVWYLEAADEGHGFAKKKNQDFQFAATVRFIQEHLLK